MITQVKVDELNRKKLKRDLHKILGGIDYDRETYKPSITTINKTFEALGRIFAEDSELQRYYKLITTVLERCVYCKRVDVPQVLIEQIQANLQEESTEDILSVEQVPYFSINTEFLNSLNVVISTSRKMENVHLETIS